MLAAQYSEFGDPPQMLEAVQTAKPEPGPGQVRIRLLMAPIHNHELWTVRGNYGIRPPLPAIGGSEACGIVDALGDGVEGVSVGQRVAVARILGTWADYFIAPAHRLVPMPDAIDDALAAQLLSMPVSALMLLESLQLDAGQWLVQNAANGAVGTTLALIAKKRGIHVINLVRTAASGASMEELGIPHVVPTDRPDWKQAVRELARGAPIVAAIDSIGGTASGELLTLLDENGTLVSFGSMSGEPMQLSSGELIFKQVTVKGFWASKISHVNGKSGTELVAEIFSLAQQGVLHLPVDRVFPLSRIKDAAAAALVGGRKGKILLRPDGAE